MIFGNICVVSSESIRLPLERDWTILLGRRKSTKNNKRLELWTVPPTDLNLDDFGEYFV